MHQPDLEKSIDRLSIVGRQCVAVICLERFCRKYGLAHTAISRFIDHVWKVTQVCPENFGEWEEVFGSMPITGQGDPYPKDLIESIPENLRDDFDQFTQFVFETGAVTWYGSNIKGTKDFLLKVLDLAVRHNIQLPDLGFYINPPVEQHDYWGSPLSDEELKQWRDMT